MICNCSMAGTVACQNCPSKQWEDEGRFPSRVFFSYGVDAVEVVRCVDCRHLEVVNKEPVYAVCEKNNHTFYLWQEDTRKFFCAYGERKDNVDS